ncbi:hypothetical protein HK096_005970 [Nowakowskiella sp. JEL0078]|nr:hypothetical protein HK096_005970 [Nowakowskiella sp. JEL0078]
MKLNIQERFQFPKLIEKPEKLAHIPTAVNSWSISAKNQKFYSLNDKLSMRQMEFAAKQIKAKRNWNKALLFINKTNQATSVFRKTLQKSRAKSRWFFAINTVLKLLRATRLFNVRHAEGENELTGNYGLGGSKSFGSDSRGLIWALRIIDCKASVILASKVQGLLSSRLPPNFSLPTADLEELDALLCRLVKYYSTFKKKQRYMFCKCAHYECYGSGTLVIREGNRPSFFYLLLSGQCEEFHTTAVGAKIATALMDAGSVFGHMEGDEVEKRESSIWCTLETEVLRIDKCDYLSILQSEVEEVNESKIEILRKHPMFSKLIEASIQNPTCEAAATIEKICDGSDIVEFIPQSVIVQEGIPTSSFYLLISGKCRALKVVPFLVRPETKHHGAMIIPYRSQNIKNSTIKNEVLPEIEIEDGQNLSKSFSIGSPIKQTFLENSPQLDIELLTLQTLSLGNTEYQIKPGERVIHHLISVFDLFSGATFPEILGPSSRVLSHVNPNKPTPSKMSIIDELTAANIALGPFCGLLNEKGTARRLISIQAENIQKSGIGSKQGLTIFRDNVLTSQFSIVASSKVVCLRMNKIDFVRLASQDTIKTVLQATAASTSDFQMENVQAMYCQKKGWDLLKKNATLETLQKSGKKRFQNDGNTKKIPLVTKVVSRD